jgi:6-pyruvoyltetrahydropterin/6-carboxytetrahydropterin synthase
VAADEHEVEVRFADRRWVFPRSECRLLPVENTTAELIARHMGQALLERLADECGMRPSGLEVGVEESPGYSAAWRWAP